MLIIDDLKSARRDRTLRSMISLFLASRSFFSVSTSNVSAFAGSSVFVSSFAGAASEYHLDAICELDGEMDCGRRKGDAVRKEVNVLNGSLVLTGFVARRRDR
jgi:hypothetical protein